jgi:transketolase
MGLEDIAMFRALSNSSILYPCDAVSAERLTETAMRTEGIVYLRLTRMSTPVVYSDAESFPLGGSKTLRSSDADRLTLIAAGVTLHEALAAHDILAQQGIMVRVIDAYSVKPIDAAALNRAAEETKTLMVVEDHWRDGGLGDAVAAALEVPAVVCRRAVTREPRSGTPAELLEYQGISRTSLVRAVRDLVAA